ncbi:PcfB family protein [Holdemania sp. Marseille-P2844]|uniref:PcfB family protein n=1 Tax=Holdemania sp. Marseille-P2844 TaxID=1852366 RepID=UPI0009326C74|nr:PcfB family protein [Holdemania sp. Marseille-P2844]
MNNTGDAAEQIVRMSLEGTEVALRLTGSAAKNIAAAIYTVLKNKDKNKLKGRQRLTAMLKSGKELKVFTISEEHLKQFAEEAKRYGVVYCALRGKGKSEDGLVDVMVRAEDASKINRIVERFKLATVDAASIKHDIEQSRAASAATPAAPEHTTPDKSAEDKLLDEMLGAPIQKEEPASSNPSAAKMEKSPPSEPTSKKPSRTAEGTAKKADDRPSVREELREIKAARQETAEKPAAPAKEQPGKKPQQKTNQHKQPGNRKKKHKSKAR